MAALSGVNTSLLDGDVPFSACGFGLDKRLSKACAKMQFVHATLVQKHCIPLALQGKDLLVRARTGSGKTAAFCLPVLQKILAAHTPSTKKSIKALILVPTKELVDQTRAHLWELMYYCRDVVSVLGLSGQSVSAQQALLRDVPDILISTPSRLVVHLEAGNVDLKSSVHTVVMDEADLVLSFGYGEDVKKIFNALPKICQHFFMSATLSPELDALKKAVLHNPAVVKLEEGHSDGKLQQYYLPVVKKDKDLLAYALIKLGVIHGKVIFFVNSTAAAYRLKLFFEQFIIKAAVLNAKLPHNSRQHIIQQFNRGMIDFLIATDDSVDKDEGDDDEADSDEEEAEDEDEDNENEEEEEEEEEEDEEEDEEEAAENDDDDAEENDEEDEDDDDDENENMLDGEDDEPEFGAFGDDDDDDDEASKPTKGKREAEGFGVSRGVDFRGVTFVINMDFPSSVKSYTHRIGRTARGGASGTALSLVATDDANEKRILEKVQSRQAPVLLESQDLVKQPAPLAFNVQEIDCFRYRVEDVRRAVTNVAVREAQLSDVKKEMLNSEKLRSHFEDHPRELNLLQHDKTVGKARIQPHLATIPTYLVPSALQAPAPAKKRKQNVNYAGKKNHKRRTDNDPLHTFTHDEPKPEAEEDRITYGDRGVGKSTSGRQKWKSMHKKGHFNPKTIAKKERKARLGAKH
ncbi:hypothetical protein SPRG_18795 [Saprolegnia parasitica CBS 223.65]|uniref:RNA helicase n=1 Tax=Saprolegnia parasitica (strain CBS 223.65) TaxID=695850 RepID=A0A067D966_SAPPC|nr:hypothetical protein SPRG_18795 [Saprolegnia parasitica CBS 223.65]KDO35547.1 hypothetical protein SPRG_18795 [Saprolegnia parasitica CBS 223.65]|eukprot:XP_012194017.1 hypothetical protein SPRG_18795 [Saprolegnia parasitica CBS 223.65]